MKTLILPPNKNEMFDKKEYNKNWYLENKERLVKNKKTITITSRKGLNVSAVRKPFLVDVVLVQTEIERER